MNNDLKQRADIAAKDSMNLNSKKLFALVFGLNKNITIVEFKFNPTMNIGVFQFADSAKCLGLVLNNSLKFREHVVSVLRRAYGALRLYIYIDRTCPLSFDPSQFAHCSLVLRFCLDRESIYN